MSGLSVPEVSVCVCTYKRPALLLQLIESLAAQSFPLAQFEVIVVDNDAAASARHIVSQASERFKDLTLYYEVEPRSGISFARNKTVALARGRHLAFIDDDEWAVAHWLSDLLACMEQTKADAVFGPVLSHYPQHSKEWAIKSKFFERSRYATGTVLQAKDGGAGNALVLASKAKARQPNAFDERFALSGGEDTDFFAWLASAGGFMVWCDTAVVTETVPLSRQTLSFILERCHRSSVGYWRNEFASRPTMWAMRKAVTGFFGGLALIACGIVLLPFGMGRSVSMWSKGVKGLGRVTAMTNVTLIGYGAKSR